MARAYLLLGANLGNREKNLCSAIAHLEKISLNRIIKSSVYETAPWGKQNQPNFLNQALIVETLSEPAKLLHELQTLEIVMGRKNKTNWEPRTIDIDILFYENEIIETDELIIPHRHICFRRFALAPLAEIAPNLEHPIQKKSVSQLLIDCKDSLSVRLKE